MSVDGSPIPRGTALASKYLGIGIEPGAPMSSACATQYPPPPSSLHHCGQHLHSPKICIYGYSWLPYPVQCKVVDSYIYTPRSMGGIRISSLQMVVDISRVNNLLRALSDPTLKASFESFLGRSSHAWTEEGVLDITYTTQGDVSRTFPESNARILNLNWLPAMMSLRRMNIKLKKGEDTLLLVEPGTPFEVTVKTTDRLRRRAGLKQYTSWGAMVCRRAAPYYKDHPSAASIFKRSAHFLQSLILMRIHLSNTTRIGDKSCLLCQAPIESQNHALGACAASMLDYRHRYHQVRDAIVESIRSVHPLIPVRVEQVPEGEVRLRPDILVDDADLSQLEKVTLHKKTKYASLSNVIVMTFGHAGIYLPSVIEDIKDLLPFSERQAFRIADDGARTAMKESFRILKKLFSQSQHL
ncbi:hypothetical protein ADUPG1_000042 [Aduncisulcus paluster]|uniref:Uncharacterized protein n=1 Tax=Aduncisulcus paluster TaxID=2918883 RepID=A0ABQ5K6E9_9EUKA|nr:hypothetical protein ADUPG1_000042 [Aduncisulcus paluster]